jgi:hypothetical protein
MEHQYTNMGKPLNTSINSLISTDYNGIIGVESATAWWGFSTFNPDISILLFNDSKAPKDGIEYNLGMSILFVPDVNKDNLVNLSHHLRITDREQTVCDMIRYNRHEFHLYETVLSAFDDESIDFDKLLRLAEYYNIKDKLYNIHELALACEDEG